MALRMNDDSGQATTLTARELLALELIVEGRSNEIIAKAVGLELDSVRAFIEQIAVKMEAPSPSEAAVRALRQGLIGPGTEPFLRRSQT